MTALIYWYYLFGSLVFMIEILSAELLFSLNYSRKARFGGRFALSCLCMLPVVALVSLGYCAVSVSFTERLWIDLTVIFTYCAMFFCSLIVLSAVYRESFASIVMSGIAGYATQHLVYCLRSFLIEALDLYSMAFQSVWHNFLFNAMQLLFFAICLGILFLLFAKRNRGQPVASPGKNAVWLSACTLIITLIFNGVRDYFSEESKGLWILCGLFSMMSCVFILVIRSGILEQSRLERDMVVIHRLMDDSRRQIELSKENIELINIKCHDIRSHLQTYSETGRAMTPEELNALKSAISVYDAMLRTGNETLDIILSERALYCEKYGIRLTCSADGSALGFMTVTEIGALFGNALNNAIEAVMKLEQADKRVINLVVKKAMGQLSVLVENYCEGEVAFVDGVPVTSKLDKSNHGFGVKSMKMIVEKYGGTLSFVVREGVFRLMALIPVSSNMG